MASGSSLPLEQAKTPRSRNGHRQATPADGPRILFLDDDPDLARAFLGRHPDAVWVETAGDCITRLAEPWDEVHLDHDLGGEIYVDSSRKTAAWRLSAGFAPSPSRRPPRYSSCTATMPMRPPRWSSLRRHRYEAVYRPFGIDVLAWLVTETEELPDLPPAATSPTCP